MSARDYLPRRVRPAVLLYHRVAPVGHPPDPLRVSPGQFEAQIRYLVEMGFTIVSLGCAGDGLRKPIAITFDDGYLDSYSVAFPILQRYGLTATIFVVSGCVGTTSCDWGPPVPVPLMTWEHAREMARHGISFQSHTRQHPDLTRCSDPVALAELRTSRIELEDRLGVAVDALAYPFGRHDARISALAAGAGYASAWTAGLAATVSPLCRERFQVSAADTMWSFALKASGWGAWLRRAREMARWRGGAGSAAPGDRWDPKPC